MQKHYRENFTSGKDLLGFLNRLTERKEMITSIVRVKTLADDREYIITSTLPTVSYMGLMNFARYVREQDNNCHLMGREPKSLEGLLDDYTKIP